MRIFTGFLLLFLVTIHSEAGTSVRYWVNGSGSWNNTANWSFTSGGNGGAPVPSVHDNVFFDENSFNQQGETVVINGIAECKNLHWRNTGKYPVLQGNKRATLKVYGSFIIDDNLSNRFEGNLILTSDSPVNIFYSISQLNSDVTFEGEGSWVLNSSLSTKGRVQTQQMNIVPEGNGVFTRGFRGSREQEEILAINQPLASAALKGTSSVLVVTAVGSTVTCFGFCDGTAGVTSVSGGVPPYDYQWFDLAANPIPGATTPSISNLCAGRYTVRVRDNATPIRNSVFVPVDVLNPPSIGIPDVDVAHVSCNNANNGIIQVNAFGGTGALSYSIDGGATYFPSNLFTNLAGGNYNVVVRDSKGCTRVFMDNPVTILNPAAIVINTASKIDVTGCFGNTNGSINVAASGGTGTLTYTLNPGGASNTTGNFSGLGIGTYTVSVTDANGCGPVTTASLVITQPPQLVITGTTHTNVNCAGEAQGTITVTASGGTGTIRFTLNPGAITNTTGFFGSLTAGTYTVAVSDDNSCGPFNTGNIVITEPPAIQITGTSKTDITCNGLSNGTIIVTATGGTGTLTYTRNPGAVSNTTGIFTGLSAGSYTVSVTDANLCGPFSTAVIDIIEPAAITINTAIPSGVSCFGGSNGSVTVTASGGTGLRTYTLNPGAVSNTTGIFSGLIAGNYTVSVTDVNFCGPVTSGVITVTQPPVIQITGTSKTDITCFGLTNGTITVTAIGGTGALTYTINPGGTSNTTGVFTGLSAGSYTVSVTDVNSCGPFITSAIQIIGPPAIQITGTSKTDITCNGLTNGTITVTATGGTGTLTYTRNPGAVSNTTGIFTGLSAGSYTISVTDANGCGPQNTAAIIIIQPAPIQITGTSKTDNNCNGLTNGSITVTAVGGTGPLTYTLNPGAVSNTTGIFTGLAANTYTVSVTDVNFCGPVTTGFITITQPPVIQITGTSKTDITCFGLTNGTITVTAIGGTGTLTYTINPGGTSNTTGVFTGLSAGSYTVSVTDVNNCGPFITSAIQIIGPPAIQITSTSKTDITCNGLTNGTITVTATGGTGTLTYTRNPGAVSNTTGIFTGLSAGSYTISVTDANGCGPQNTAAIIIIQPAPIQITGTSKTDINCNGLNNGSITVTASGGTGTLTYTLNPGAVSNTTGIFTGLAPNTYTVSVNDVNFCGPVTTGFITITQPPVIQITGTSKTDITCFGLTNGTITVTAIGGTGTLTYTINPGGTSNITGVFTGLSAGSYTVSVTDVNNCGPFITSAIQIIGPPAIQITGTSKTDILCSGLTTGTITVTATGGTGTLTYTLNPGAVSNTTGIFTGLSAGSYTVSITDTNGCGPVVSSAIQIIEPAQIQITGIIKTDISCFGIADGSITATATGGTAPLVYTILPPGTSNTTGLFTGLAAGSYTISVNDFNNCGPVTSAPVVIVQPNEITTIVTVTNAICNGTATGTIIINASDGVPPYSYSVNGGLTYQAGNSFMSLATGSYHVFVRDANGCTKDAGTYIISEPAPVTFTFNSTGITCYGLADGIIEFNASGGTPPYTYSIYGNDPAEYQAGNIFTNLGPDTYELIVRDNNGCLSASVFFTMDDPAQIFVGFSAPAITTCFGDPGTITLTGTGGSGSLEYSISTTQFVPGTWQASGVFTGLHGGVPYFGFVRDMVTGCIAYANNGNSITINQPSEIIYSVTSVVHVTGCSYSTNGVIRISLPTGGAPPYTYFRNGISNGTSRIFTNVPVGTHLIEAVDSRGCRKPTNVVVNGPAPIVYSSFIKTDVTTCFGANTGSIVVSASGGTGVLSYSLNGAPPVGSGSFTNLTAGVYNLVVRDANGCFRDTTVTITQPPMMTISVAKTNVTCFGAIDGTITISITGGVMPYQYSVDNGASYFPTGNFTNLAPGTYSVVSRDANGCIQHGGNITIFEPALLTITSETIVNPTNCPGDPGNGIITIAASGGTTPLQFSIDGGLNYFSNGGIFTGLPVGTYQVAVRDARGCVAMGSAISLTGILPITLDVTSTNISCSGEVDGSITIVASGGGGTFEYSINGGADYFSSGSFSALTAGDYEIMVRDNLGCTQSGGTITITEPQALLVDIQVTHVTFGGPVDAGQLNIIASGGTPPYEYSIDGGLNFIGSQLFTGLTIGDYDVVVRDANGCEFTSTVTILELPPFNFVLDVTHLNCFGANDGSITISASNGIEPFEYSIDGGLNYFPTGAFINLAGGVYPVSIRDAGGYTYSTSVVLNEPTEIVITGLTTDATCNLSTSDGSIEINVSGGTGPYNFLWSDGSSTQNILNVYGGNYTVTVTDDSGCFKEATFFVNSTHQVNVDLGADFSVCSDSIVQLNAVYSQSGTTAIFSWVSNPSETIAPVSDPFVRPGYPASIYTVTLTDENGCFASSTVEISVFDVPEIDAGEDVTIMTGASATLTASPDVFVSYSWTPAEGLNTTSGISVIATPAVTTTYYVTGITTDGCQSTDSVIVRIPLPIRPASGLTPNNDGINDFWEIENAEDYPELLVEVFNRYGQKVFSSRGYNDNQRWGGTYKGRLLPVGTYYFVIKLNDSFGIKPITGPVTIVR